MNSKFSRKFAKMDTMFACPVCSVQASKMKRCTRCKHVYYCSRECQISDWPDHRIKCINVSSNNNSSDKREDSDSVRVKESLSLPDKEAYNDNNSGKRCYLHNNEYHYDVPNLDASEESYTVTLRFNKQKEKTFIQRSWSGLEIWKLISHLSRIPFESLKVICKGKQVTPETIVGVVNGGVVLLVLGETAEDESGVDSREVQILMQQMSVSRNTAVKSMKKCGNLVDAILDVGSK